MNKASKFLLSRNNARYKKKVKKEVLQIREYVKTIEHLSDNDLRELLDSLKIPSYKEIRKNLVPIYAIAVEAIRRVVGVTLYDSQLQGAIVLYDGNVAEMKTGEGKTLTSALPVILNASTGHNTHVVTVNEYLTARDKEILEPIYNLLGFTVGLNRTQMPIVSKREAYNSNIMYSTATELGFDYLKDNMVKTLSEKVNQHGYNSAVIDEIDLVLIDEARTPLIIGKQDSLEIGGVMKAQAFVKTLNKNDYEVNKHSKAVWLTKSGEEKANKSYDVENIYSEDNIFNLHLINQALVANFLYKKDVDYAVHAGNKRFNEIQIIDGFSGRIQEGRRFSYGLHQALEAKHLKNGVQIKEENKTTATITLQNFFRLYEKLSGMSGTAKEEVEEFIEVYGLNIIEIDTNKPVIREDKPIIALSNKKEKWATIVEKIKEYNSQGNPILIGTVSVSDSEELSKILTKENLQHKVLNAKQDKQEAAIISEAGRKNAITIATNMAGRGTDIKVENGYKLIVFVTELNESVRIDNQLKGRTSRQGAPGTTETIISTEDSIFSKTKIADIKKFNLTNPLPKAFVKMLSMVQEELENMGYGARKNALKYDDVIREQREIFYKTRDNILLSYANGSDLLENNMKYILRNDGELLEHLMTILNQSQGRKNYVLKEILLFAMDEAWVNHIDKLENLKGGIGWRAQSGKNPIITYQNEAKILFDEFKDEIYELIKETVLQLRDAANLHTKNVYKGVR